MEVVKGLEFGVEGEGVGVEGGDQGGGGGQWRFGVWRGRE